MLLLTYLQMFIVAFFFPNRFIEMIFTIFCLAQSTNWYAWQSLSHATAPFCLAGSCAIEMEHMKKAFWFERYILITGTYCTIGYTTNRPHSYHCPSNPNHGVLMYSIAVEFRRKTFWSDEWRGRNIFLMKSL